MVSPCAATATRVHQSPDAAQSATLLAASPGWRYERRTVPGRASSRDTWLTLAAIALGTALVYAGSFAGDWISDDVEAIAQNPILRSLAPSNLWVLATSRTDGVNYIPLSFLSLAIDNRLFGMHPFGFHLTNLLIHIAGAIVAYFVVLRIDRSPGIAAAASLLWAVHPVQVESVAWISERKNVLSTLFFLLAFLTYLRWTERPDWRRYVLLVILFVAALLSKVNTIVLPALILVYEIVAHRRLRFRDVAFTLPLFACGAVVAWANLHGNTSHGASYHGGSFAVTMRTSATTIPRYLLNVVAPFDLMSYYPVPLRASWLDPPVAAAVAVIVGLIVITCWLALRGRSEAFWLAWFGITMAPMLNIVPFPALMNDRYLYVPLLGMLVPLLTVGRGLLTQVRAPNATRPILVGAAAIVLGVLTVARIPVFANELNLWADYGLRTSYITADEPYGPNPRVEERRLLNEALALHPNRAALHNNLGGFAFEENRLAEALPLLERAYALDPTDPVIALNLGRTYLRVGRLDDAIRTLEAAIALEPPSFFPRLNLARAYLMKKDLPRARAELTRAKAYKSDPYFWQRFEQALTRAEQQAS
jgi:hypothetical protein